MLTVEFIYDADCPNVAATRENLIRAFTQAGLPAKWTEWERSRSDTPDYARYFGSPAVLINGRDLAGLPPNSAATCRLYHTPEGVSSGIPSMAMIVEALEHANASDTPTASGRLKAQLPFLPAIAVALLPKLACPACWPAYAGVLSAVGLGFVARTEYLLPLTVAFLVVALGSLGFRARCRRGYAPLGAGIVAATMVLLGKFWVESDVLFYSGLVLLAGSSLWNTWPQKSKNASCCEGAPRRMPA